MPSQRPDRGPRKPIKGRRRTFDIDSKPNAREQEHLRRKSKRPSTAPDDESSDARPAHDVERWVDEGPVRKAAGDAVRRGGRKPGSKRTNDGGKPGRRGDGDRGRARPQGSSSTDRNQKRTAERAAKRAGDALEIDQNRLRQRLGASRAARTIDRLGEASAAFAQDRFDEANKLLKPLVQLVPDEPAIRELYGLSLYRLGRWKAASNELEEFGRLSGSTDQHPVLADCYRALGRHSLVEDLWTELGETSPAAALVAEGRIVYAGSLADQGKLAEAIRVLEGGALGSGKLKPHHLRMRYALGDLYERVGERQSARRQFEAIATQDSRFFDVAERLSVL